MADVIPSAAKKKLEDACRKAAKKVAKVAPGEKNEKKLAGLLHDNVCKEAKSIDQKVLKLIAEEFAKLGKKHSAKAPEGTIPNVKAVGKPKAPGAGSPSVTIPLGDIMLNEKLGTKGKFSLKVWADPKDLAKSEKGAMLYFTVVNW